LNEPQTTKSPPQKEYFSMNQPIQDIVPMMREFYISNQHLGDFAALRVAWERDGYLYFRDVLDHEPLDRMRGLLVNHLANKGFIDANDVELRWSGKEREGVTFFPVEEMNDIRAAKTVMEDPKIRDFFLRLFGVPLRWVPFTEYRTTPPAIAPQNNRFDFIHEDAVYSDRLDFIICWIPLSTIDADVGGLAVAEGMHKVEPSLHKKEGYKIHPIQPSQIPLDAWVRTTYRLGDLLLMSRRTPHSGLANHSDHFRLSLDTRILPEGGDFPFIPRLPYIGILTLLEPNRIVVLDGEQEHLLRLDETSYVRGFQGNRLLPEEVTSVYQIGTEVIVAYDGDLVQTMRPQH
jgi:Phytanoyl-CoA dioxygenase (PhyH)